MNLLVCNAQNIPLIGCLLCSAICLVGCQGPPQQYQQAYAQLQREKIEIEDEYYLLEADFIALKNELAKCRGQEPGDGLQNQDQFNSPDTIPEINEPGFGMYGTQKEATLGAGREIEEIQAFRGKSGRPTPADKQQAESGLNQTDGVARASNWVPATSERQSLPNAQIVAIEIAPGTLRGFDSDGEFGDDGFELIIQPLDNEGGVVPLRGNVSVTLVDPTKDRNSQSVGKWTYSSSDESQDIQDQVNEVPGILLSVPFKPEFHVNDQLLVYISYSIGDGPHLKTSAELQLRLPGQTGSDRWTEHRDSGQIRRESTRTKGTIPDWSPDR